LKEEAELALQVFDTLRGGKHLFEPQRPGEVGMYVCGMTVQAPPHVGHMRAYVVADVIRRIFRARGYRVTLVQNFTDIDDKIIAKANAEGIGYRELAERNIAAYFRAADWLGIERAEHYPRATDHIPEILSMIETLIEKGFAYPSKGDVFFDVTRMPGYGSLSGKNIEDLRSGVRIEVNEDKRHPVDFALWKGAKPGEPAWESPWGPGRPGWHIECSAMAMKYLGDTIDLHGGGRDLIFPHHENERAQSEASTGRVFARHWIENGMVNLGGQKMSKSTGVFFAVEDVRQEVDPVSLRLYLLSTHYRSPIEYSRERLTEARAAQERIQNFLIAADHVSAGGDGAHPGDGRRGDGEAGGALEQLHESLNRLETEAQESFDDDFNTAGALGKVFEIVRLGNSLIAEGTPTAHHRAVVQRARELVLELTSLLGITWAGEESGISEIPAEIMDLVLQREAARKGKHWAAADDLRKRIQEQGYSVEDRQDGPLVKPAV
jgi:cysteinyl-tRNA synthetase